MLSGSVHVWTRPLRWDYSSCHVAICKKFIQTSLQVPAVQGMHFLGDGGVRGSSTSGSMSLSDHSDTHSHALSVPMSAVSEPLVDPPGDLKTLDTGCKMKLAFKHVPRPSSVPIDMTPYKIVATQIQAFEFVESQSPDIGSELR